MLEISDEQYKLLFDELSLDEGIRLNVYSDTKGIKTVGIGCNIQAHDTKPIIGRKLTKIGEQITKDECLLLFKANLIDVCLIPLDKNLPVLTKQLDPVRLRALINLCFNMGWGTLSTFKNTLAYLQSKNYIKAAENLVNSKWYKQVKTRGPRVVYMIQYGKHHPEYEKAYNSK